MHRILEYLETPQYLRKALYPMHPDLKYAGLLNPLDAPHHLRYNEMSPYREGVVLARPVKKTDKGSFVDVGFGKPIQVDRILDTNTRVTIELDDVFDSTKSDKAGISETNHIIPSKATIVSPKKPKHKSGLYWGYTVRLASGLVEIFDECPFDSGYDLKIGTSERGDAIETIEKDLPPFK